MVNDAAPPVRPMPRDADDGVADLEQDHRVARQRIDQAAVVAAAITLSA